MERYSCYQAAEATQVVTTDGSGAVVTISRAVGNPMARALMRLATDVLNGDLLAAQHELDRMLADDGAVGLQERAAGWHAQRFPEAQAYNVMLKATEELGEVAEALNGVLAGRDAASSHRIDVAREAADVAITLLVLLGRWFPDENLLDHVEEKLDILADPTSGHRSAALP